MNAKQAKDQVFAHWSYLLRLCRRKFPGDTTLADEASTYVLDGLQAHDWHRVREWQEQGNFQTFLAVLVHRLLLDFYRQRFGYQRPPKWLREEIDKEEKVSEPPQATNQVGAPPTSLWRLAYRLLNRDHYSRQEAVHRLLTQEPSSARERIEHIVTMVLARCPPPIMSPDAPKQSLDEVGEVESEQPDPSMHWISEENRRLAELAGSLLENGTMTSAQPTSEQLERLRRSLHLTEEDRLLLRLRYAEGLAVPTIAKMLGLKGDPYKRLGRIIGDLERAFHQVELYKAREQP